MNDIKDSINRLDNFIELKKQWKKEARQLIKKQEKETNEVWIEAKKLNFINKYVSEKQNEWNKENPPNK